MELTILAAVPKDPDGGAAAAYPILKVFAALYMIPSFVALLRAGRTQSSLISIFLLNLFLGWTGKGWWLALKRATDTDTLRRQRRDEAAAPPAGDKYSRLSTLNELRNSGGLTDEEYEAEKRRLLKK